MPCVDESWWERPVGDQPAQVHVLCPVGGLSEPESVDPELKGAYSTRVIQGLRPRKWRVGQREGSVGSVPGRPGGS